jgi:hypothetical protein
VGSLQVSSNSQKTATEPYNNPKKNRKNDEILNISLKSKFPGQSLNEFFIQVENLKFLISH